MVLAADFDVNVNFLDEKAFHVSYVRLWYFPTYLDPSEEEHSLNVNELRREVLGDITGCLFESAIS